MTKKNRLGIPAIALVFGISLIACGHQSGMLIITNIPSKFNGQYVFISAEHEETFVAILGLVNPDFSPFRTGGNIIADLPKISNGRVRIPLWTFDVCWLEFELNDSPYSGNDTFEELLFLFKDEKIGTSENPYREALVMQLVTAFGFFESVTFVNGNAAVSFHDAAAFREGDSVDLVRGDWRN